MSKPYYSYLNVNVQKNSFSHLVPIPRPDGSLNKVLQSSKSIFILSFCSVLLGELLRLHGKLLRFHRKLLRFHGELLRFHGELLRLHGKLLRFHRELLRFHGELLRLHGELLRLHNCIGNC